MIFRQEFDDPGDENVQFLGQAKKKIGLSSEFFQKVIRVCGFYFIISKYFIFAK